MNKIQTKNASHIFLAICLLVQKVHSSHFRGGIITWKQTGTQQIEISYRLAFRRDSSSNHMCNDSNIINGVILNGEGVLQCYHGCNGIIANPMSYYCTDYSVDENWAAGQRSVSYNFTPTTDNVFQFRYGSCCWISLVVGSGSWVLLATADLSVRQDTGKINTSPVSAMQPIVRFKYGCSYSLRIPVQDDDGDIVKCRWANNTECSATACLLSYTASGNTGWYAAALQIEDYAMSDITTPLSSVPLQFLIEVSSTTDTCDDKPLVLNLTNVNDSVASLTPNTTFFQTIIANSGSTSVNITEIATVSPVGMIKTELLPYGSSGTEWHVNVTWTPSQSQAGSHIFCYTAVNSVGQSSDQACVTIKVDDENECASNPCQNGDTDFCEGSICENNGTCVDGVFNYTCTCPSSHTGFHCESDIDFCQYVDLPCRNGGTCIDGLFDYKCACPLKHIGDHCDIEADNTGYVLSLLFVSGGLVLSGIVTVVVIKSLVSYVKGPGSSVDTHNHFYM
ncbi:unnamed protein product [Mytilus coruscus]|uniref:EGF-like domain-containing protein n=1 Tax=Mytilus coruscus TaxID=42192 RepID=A0A6J8CYI3_MYTCO|nr:unnamed protein product [Mytilus coruscus]